NKSQAARTRALDGFKEGKVAVLVATDIAARGIDIDQLPHVVNFELPNVPEDYVHRIGRTGRAGSEGSALSLVDRTEAKYLSAIEKLIKRPIERSTIEGWTPPAVTESLDERESRPPRRNGQGRPQGQTRRPAPGEAARRGGGARGAGGQARPARSAQSRSGS